MEVLGLSIKYDENIRELRKFMLFIIIGILVLNMILNYAIIADKKVYSSIGKFVLIITIICSIISIILGMNDNKLLQVIYLGGSLIGNFTILSLYLLSINYLKPESVYSRILLLLNFLIIEFVVFFRRIIMKDSKYILAIQNGKHDGYVKCDIAIALIMSGIIISISKAIDINPVNFLSQNFDLILAGIGGVTVAIIGIVVNITAIANYLYTIKKRIKNLVGAGMEIKRNKISQKDQ